MTDYELIDAVLLRVDGSVQMSAEEQAAWRRWRDWKLPLPPLFTGNVFEDESTITVPGDRYVGKMSDGYVNEEDFPDAGCRTADSERGQCVLDDGHEGECRYADDSFEGWDGWRCPECGYLAVASSTGEGPEVIGPRAALEFVRDELLLNGPGQGTLQQRAEIAASIARAVLNGDRIRGGTEQYRIRIDERRGVSATYIDRDEPEKGWNPATIGTTTREHLPPELRDLDKALHIVVTRGHCADGHVWADGFSPHCGECAAVAAAANHAENAIDHVLKTAYPDGEYAHANEESHE